MEVTAEFLRLFLRGLYFISPLLLILLLIIVLIGQIVGRHEAWSKFDAFYWSFITAITVGYGDFHPRKRLSKGLAILTALVGIIFTGIVVAVALHAAQTSFRKYI
ncbi:MAG: potassium channel family protein [Kiritimatiellaeota bacterium]|nr:potassium channel family protein [Kiritimatiellota bacterium]